ncbi:MAG: septum formation initiator family protein, partial [Alphaproteobacteria bacterium]|nr:septum formation initiator family protein [Alphaproteobacteria bacterium]
ERGIISWMSLSQKVQEEEKVLQALTSQQKALEQRVKLLRPDSLDLDMLDEQARRLLNYSRKQEIVIYDEDLETSHPKKNLESEESF